MKLFNFKKKKKSSSFLKKITPKTLNEDLIDGISQVEEDENVKKEVTNQNPNRFVKHNYGLIKQKAVTSTPKKVLELEQIFAQQVIFTEVDLEKFSIPKDLVQPLFKNGRIFYKKKPVYEENVAELSGFFKDNTRFVARQPHRYSNSDLLDHNAKRYEENNAFLDEIDLKTKAKYLDQSNKIKYLYDQLAASNKTIDILQKDHSGVPVIYKVSNLEYRNWNEDEIYYGYQLKGITFDVANCEQIVIYSDDFITNQLLIDVLRGDENKLDGYIFKNVKQVSKWVDIEEFNLSNFDPNSEANLTVELLNGLASPDYYAIGFKKKDTLNSAITKLFKTFDGKLDESFQEELIVALELDIYWNNSIGELDDLMRERFWTLCDMLIGKKVLLIKSICQNMSYNQKTNLLNLIRSYCISIRATLIYASNDFTDANVIGDRFLVINQAQLVANERIEAILTTYHSVQNFILSHITYDESTAESLQEQEEQFEQEQEEQ